MRDVSPSDSLRDPDPADPPPPAAAAAVPGPPAPPAETAAAGQLQPVLGRLAALLERALGAEAPTAAAAVDSAAADFAAWRPPPLSDAVLQELRFSAPRSGPGVAYRVLEGQAQALEAGIMLLGGARVSFDTYLNSFYEHYWLTHAPVEDLSLRLFGSGEVLVETFRAMPDGSAYRIGHHRLRLDPEGSAAARVALDAGPASAGRIFFEVAAPARAAILAGRLETGTPPARPVRLGIGLCTFNRERMLLATSPPRGGKRRRRPVCWRRRRRRGCASTPGRRSWVSRRAESGAPPPEIDAAVRPAVKPPARRLSCPRARCGSSARRRSP